jgi:hypothetical protein
MIFTLYFLQAYGTYRVLKKIPFRLSTGQIVPSSAELAMMAAKARSPVLFLDLRARNLIEAADRQQFIDKSKEVPAPK